MTKMSPKQLRERANAKLNEQVDLFIENVVHPNITESAEKGFTGWKKLINRSVLTDEEQVMFGHPDFLKTLINKMDDDFKIAFEYEDPLFSFMAKSKRLVIRW